MKRHLSTGPPVYFVVTDGLNLTEKTDQNLLCGGVHCDSYSVTNQIYRASKLPNVYVSIVADVYYMYNSLFNEFGFF